MAKYTLKDLERDLFKRNKKYVVMGIAVGIVHLLFLLFFYIIGYMPMVVYNVVAITLYIYFGVTCSQGDNLVKMFLYYYIEIPLHSILCTILLGWNFNFMFFIFCTIPTLFYLGMFIDELKHNILMPVGTSIVLSAIYIIMKYFMTNRTGILPYTTIVKYGKFFSYFGPIFTLVAIIMVCSLISLEYNYIKNKLKNENTVLDTQASYDVLTGLLNRRSMDSHLDNIFIEYYREEEAFSIIMCDIDHFKNVNDTYGHDAGDYVLKEACQVISSEVRDKDLVGRWGGEEFLIVLFANKLAAAKLAERIRAQIEAHQFSYKNQTLRVTMTFGVSAYHAGSDVDSLIKSADKKLYRGKENGRNQVVF